jgi:hypothetical protein
VSNFPGSLRIGCTIAVERTGANEVRIERRCCPGPDVEFVTLAVAKARGFDFTGPWPPPEREPLVVTSVDRERGVITFGGGK